MAILYLSKKDIGVYVDSLWNKTKFDGKFGYTFPWYASPQVLFINDEVFKKAGLNPVKDAPKSWEEMEKVGKIIKEKTGVTAFSLEFANIAWEEPLRIGAQVFNKDLTKTAFNTQKFAARLEYLHLVYDEGLLPKALPDYQTCRSMFEQGQLAMFPLGISMYRWIKADNPKLAFTVAPYPVSKTGANRLHVSMMNFVLMKASKQKKAAVEFAKFITGPYAQIEFAKGADQGKVQAQMLAAATMKNGDNLIVTFVPKNVTEIYNTMGTQFLAAIRGEKTVKEALKAAETQANQMITAGN